MCAKLCRARVIVYGGVVLLVALATLLQIGAPTTVHAWTINVAVAYTPVVVGGNTTILWNGTDGAAEYCYISGPTINASNGTQGKGGPYFVQVNGATGSYYAGPINGSYTYTISCVNVDDGGGGGYGSNSITVVPSTPTSLSSFAASPVALPARHSGTTLSWSGTAGTNFAGCTLSGGQWGSGVAVGINSSTATAALTTSTAYTLTCNDSMYGPTSRSITVPVGAAVSADASISPTAISAGQSATISFFANSATAPTSCQINNYNDTVALYNVAGCSSAQARTYNTGVLSTPGSYSYKFYYYQNAWVLAKTVTVSVAPVCTLSASPNPVSSGSATTLTYTSSGATSGSIDNGVGALPSNTPGTPKKIFLTAGSSWTVPADWNSANNTVEVIGGGGGGAAGQPAPVYSGGAGGGGAYAKRSNVVLTPGASVTYRVGPAGTASGAGGDTYFCNSASNCASIAGTAVVAGAKGGSGASTHSGGSGGATAQSIGDASAIFAGGNGGGGWAAGGGGGGAAAGPSGRGGKGGSMVASAYGGGGGGGANNGANAANTAANNNGTAGGHNASGVGGGAGGTASVAGSPGSSGGGGGGGGGNSGASGAPGGAGGAGTTWTATNVWNGTAYTGATPTSGPGGGGGGGGGAGPGAASYGASGASYGAGGGGGGTGTSNGAGAAGAQGIIVVSYTPNVFTPNGTIATPAITTTPTTFTMTVTDSVSGLSGTCSVPVTITDVCTDISGFQTAAPASPCVTPVPSPGQCVPSGYTYNGSACVVSAATISGFSGPSRVRRGTTATLTYTITNPPASCSVVGNNDFSTSVTPTSGVQGSVVTNAILANTTFVLSCGTVTSSATVGVTPEFQEI